MSEVLEKFFALKMRYQGTRVLGRMHLLNHDFAELEASTDSPSLRRSIRNFINEENAKRRLESVRLTEEYRLKRDLYVTERLAVMERWSQREIQRSTAQSLVKASAWWLTHSSGNPVRAPGHADRIQLLKQGWSIEFGANNFLIGKFVQKSTPHLIAGFNLVKENQTPNRKFFQQKLRKEARGCVANYNLDLYEDYAPNRGQLVFGAQAIDLDDASDYLIDASGLGRHCFLANGA